MRLSFETVTGRSAISCKATMDFLQKHHAIFVNVDAPESDHFMVMPSDVDEGDEFERRISSTAWTQREAYITGKTVATRFDYDYNDE